MTMLYLIVFFQSILYVFSWGPIGHGLVARLAQSQLNSTANNWINSYIPMGLSDQLSAVASWPDAILYPDTNPTDFRTWQWSRDLHFINTPDWKCNYDPIRDCLRNRCVEGALKNYSRRLIDHNSDYIQQQEALFFLVHFVGDVHQPLHCGFKGDFGGNLVKGFFLNGTNSTNLHTIWDVEIINKRIERYFQSDVNLYYLYLKNLMNKEQSLLTDEIYNNYKIWINESVDYVCQQVYFDDNNIKFNMTVNFTLGENYFNRNWPIVDQRLVRAGYRLGLLLNHLSEQRSSSKLPPYMKALIFILCCEFVIVILTIIASFFLYRRYYKKKPDVLISE